jgi:hydrogenase expression/formation protein HypC
MCLAIPMRIVAIDGFTAHCDARGVRREVSLFMMQDALPAVGDYIMMQLGYAIQKVSEADALASWQLLDQIIEELGPQTQVCG